MHEVGPAPGGEPEQTVDESASAPRAEAEAPPQPPAETEQPPPGKARRRQINPFVELVLILVAAFGLWYVIDGWVVKPYKIPSASMEPTLQEGDRVLVARFIYHLHGPRRGDVVVFHPPGTGSTVQRGATTEASVYFIKRVIGLPGETVEGRNGHVQVCKAHEVDCRSLTEPYLMSPGQVADFGPVTVPKGQYFVMGDNRGDSDDSRDWGTLPRGNIIGGAFAIYWPLDRISTL